MGEPIEQAAVREAREETSLNVTLREMLYVYGEPTRDPRGHTVSVVFVATGTGTLEAADDAKGARVFMKGDLPGPIAFDHGEILKDYFRFRETGARPAPLVEKPK